MCIRDRLGEVSPGGVGVGLMGLLIYALLAVFIAGLMVGRTPEYLGKKIQATEMKLVVLFIVVMPLTVLGLSAVSIRLGTVLDQSIQDPGAHGLSEVLYAFTSATNNNGSAFAGLDASTCLLYTSDAADERSSVDLGGRRIIQTKNTTTTYIEATRR